MIEIHGVTYARMADSVNPAGLPPGMDAYLGYVNGHWPDYAAIAQAHGDVPVYGLTVFPGAWGDGDDAEPGNMSVAQAVADTKLELVRGVSRPIKYCPLSWAQAMVASHYQAGISRTSYRLLTAHYGAGQHICTPACGYGFTGYADGTQWIDHNDVWDESLLRVDFLLDASHPGPEPISPHLPVPPPRPIEGENMRILSANVYTDGLGNGFTSPDIDLGGSQPTGAAPDVLAAEPGKPDPAPDGSRYDKVHATRCIGAKPGFVRIQVTGGAPSATYGVELQVSP